MEIERSEDEQPTPFDGKADRGKEPITPESVHPERAFTEGIGALEKLSHELWERGFPTAQNKLWRLENNPPKRIDSELLLWLEKVLGVELFGSGEKQQVLIEDVLEILDGFADPAGETALPIVPRSGELQQIHEKVAALARAVAR